MMRVKLAQDRKGYKTEWVCVESFAEASSVVRQYIDSHNLGSRDWTGGEVKCKGSIIANVSYNGRVWNSNGEELKII